MYNNEISYIKKNGFCVLRNFFDIKLCKQIAEKIEQKNYKSRDGWEVIYNPYIIDPRLIDFVNHKKILKFIK